MAADSPFNARIRAALSDPDLQIALDGNADRRQQAFTLAYKSLPEALPVMRQRAHAIRAKTISNLEAYLSQFISNARSHGIIVHRASDAEQAINIVRQIAQQAGAQLVAKSKSMVSEEIHLNKALQEDGIQVIETDLGEYIVQLRDEPPAHIITPAVHLDRGDVGELFENKLGIPYTEDIPTLTAAARRVLRQTFLESDLGISGVNFGVAETGSLCIVTNEGNGRMVTTLPDVHIALMGIERLVPTLDDLATLLYLLPRSATGQKITVYTSLIHGPRGNGEIDGPRQRHLVLLDNGRQSLRASPFEEALYCIRCGACLNVCPIFREIGGHAYVGAHDQNTAYPGPIGSVISPALFGISEFGQLARASSLCGACKEACPVDIDLPRLLLRVRAAPENQDSSSLQIAKASPAAPIPKGLKAGLRLFAGVATSSWRFATAQRLMGLFSRLFAPVSPWLRLPAFTGWGYQRDFPRPAIQPFRSRFQQLNPVAPISPTLPEEPVNETETPAPQNTHPSSETALDRFESELTLLGGSFSICQEEELPEELLKVLAEHRITRLQAWSTEHLPHRLLETLRANGIQVELEPDPSIPAGLTGALGGIAETGSLIITSGAGRPLTASLLPEIHFVILRAGSIFPDLRQALAQEQVRSASSTVLVSGPSRTADIEMTLTIGVHGPRQVHVFCI